MTDEIPNPLSNEQLQATGERLSVNEATEPLAFTPESSQHISEMITFNANSISTVHERSGIENRTELIDIPPGSSITTQSEVDPSNKQNLTPVGKESSGVESSPSVATAEGGSQFTEKTAPTGVATAAGGLHLTEMNLAGERNAVGEGMLQVSDVTPVGKESRGVESSPSVATTQGGSQFTEKSAPPGVATAAGGIHLPEKKLTEERNDAGEGMSDVTPVGKESSEVGSFPSVAPAEGGPNFTEKTAPTGVATAAGGPHLTENELTGSEVESSPSVAPAEGGPNFTEKSASLGVATAAGGPHFTEKELTEERNVTNTSVVVTSVAAGEGMLQVSHDKGGMTPSSPLLEMSSTTRSSIISEPGSRFPIVIESQQIGGETSDAVHPASGNVEGLSEFAVKSSTFVSEEGLQGSRKKGGMTPSALQIQTPNALTCPGIVEVQLRPVGQVGPAIDDSERVTQVQSVSRNQKLSDSDIPLKLAKKTTPGRSMLRNVQVKHVYKKSKEGKTVPKTYTIRGNPQAAALFYDSPSGNRMSSDSASSESMEETMGKRSSSESTIETARGKRSRGNKGSSPPKKKKAITPPAKSNMAGDVLGQTSVAVASSGTRAASKKKVEGDLAKAGNSTSTESSDGILSSSERTSSSSSSGKHRRKRSQRSKRREERKRMKQLLFNDAGIIHPVYVINKQLADELRDTSIVVQGYHRTRISLTNWVTSFCLITHIGTKLRRKPTWCEESIDRTEISLIDFEENEIFTVMCPVSDLEEDEVIQLIPEKGRSVNIKSDYALLLVVAKVVPDADGDDSSTVDWSAIKAIVRAGKPNLVKQDGTSHFGSRGEAYGFGLRGGYEKLTPSKKVSVGMYASKPISELPSDQLSEAETICKRAIGDAANSLEDKLPGFIRAITSPLKSIADCAKKHPHLEELVRRDSTFGQEKKPLYFQSFFVNVNASTEVPHSEKDCSYTMIYSPDTPSDEEHDVRFEFSITNQHCLEIVMGGGVVFCYSAYVLTHR